MASIPVKVCVRVRPLNGKENREGSKECVEFYGENQVALSGRFFTFDRVFNPRSSQDDVYDSCASHLIDNLFKGFNCTILAYGQTGSGKTFTMGTEETTDSISSTTRGIIPRMVESIFTRVAATEDPTLFTVSVSMLEIYDEKVYDLLGEQRSDPLAIRESNKGVYVQDLSWNPVRSLTDTMAYLERGCGLRKKGGTAMNEQSSRSHAVFAVVVQRAEDEQAPSFEAKLHLVDLAGSERLKKTMAEGERKKEGIRINEGLLALGNVISALSDGLKHIPYRNSCITRILQDSLGGNSYTVMIACVSPAESNNEETLSTLRYADRTKKIKNNPVVNTDPTSAALKLLQEENRALKREIARLKASRAERSSDSDDEEMTEQGSNTDLEMEEKILELQEMCHRHLREKADLVSKHVHANDMLEKLHAKFEAARSLLETDEVNINELRELLAVDIEEANESVHSIPPDNEDAEDQEHSIEAVAQTVHSINGDVERLKQMIDDRQKAVAEAAEKNEKYSHQYNESREEIRKLNSEVTKLLEEKEMLNRKLKEITNHGKVSDEYRRRLKELEREQSALKVKLKEYARYESMKKESDKALARARSELESAKKMRVEMMKKLRVESAKFMRMKTLLDRANAQIQRAERKREFEVAASKRTHEMQLNVMRRKLADSQAQAKRLQRQFARQTGKSRRNNKNILDLPGYVKQELDVAVNIWETQQLLKEYAEQRKKLEAERKRLHQQRKGEPFTKRRRTEVSPPKEISADRFEEDLNALQHSIDVRQKEIAQLEERCAEMKPNSHEDRWAVCDTPELCSVALNNLFDLAQKARVEVVQKSKKITDLTRELKDAKEEAQELLRTGRTRRLSSDLNTTNIIDHKRPRVSRVLDHGFLDTLEVIPDVEGDDSFEDKNDERFPTPVECRVRRRRDPDTSDKAPTKLNFDDDEEDEEVPIRPFGSNLHNTEGTRNRIKFPDV
uniref:Kinesin-like protein n=1 Tax=Steinernema glaseri TaxID=37863 RepID=A0A1I7Y2D8_9BILA